MPVRGRPRTALQPGEARTIPDLWLRATREPAANPPYLVESDGGWRPVRWDEAAERVDALAGGFLSVGIVKGDRVGIMCRTRLEWSLCDFALASLGAVVVPVYTVSSVEERLYILADSGSRLLVAEAKEYAKIEHARGELAGLERVVGIENVPGADLSLAELESRGREHLGRNPQALADARAAVEADDPLTIVYTSGTTGPPKGCVLTHGNWCAMVEGIVRVPKLVEPGDRVVLHLPLAHVFARLVEFLGARLSLTIAFCPDSARLLRALQTARPTIFPSVPRVYETIHQGVRSSFEEVTGARRRVVDRALAVGRETSRRRQAGEPLGVRLAAELALANRLVFSKLAARLGGRLRVGVSGGAPLSREVAEFLDAVGLLVLEGYGLSEGTAVVSVNRADRYRFGTVGIPVPGVEVALADDGEMLVRGETVFSGYHGDEEATRAVFTDDGWLRTGDLGVLDDDGFLTIVGRKKEIIVTSNGANIAPENIERALTASKYVSQALVVGDRRPHVGALLTVNRREARTVAQTDEEVRALVAEVVADVNRRLGPEEKVRSFAILDRDFTTDQGEMTPTLKVKRRVVEDRFRDEIEELYAAPHTRPSEDGDEA
ncbi:MAG TPA: long-chain fatty acid--CoA ligase [Gaiellaceae bacterium]|nr:long-chain fatty acid--CoA ligase [Gaiellaceae bacterium]